MNLYVGQKVKAHCTLGRERRDNNDTMLREGIITYIHPEGRHVEVNFGPYSECVFPGQVFSLDKN